MLRLSPASLALLLAGLLAPACIGTGNSINAYAGVRSVDSQDLEDADLDDQNVYGADAVLKLDLPWLAFEGGWLHSEEEDSGAKVELDEYFVGLRATPWTFLVQPYVAAGATYIDGQLSGAGDDANLGFYGRVGAAVPIGILRLGLDGRATVGRNFDFDTIESDVTNYQLSAFVGVGF